MAAAVELDDDEVERRVYGRRLADGTLRRCRCGCVFNPDPNDEGANLWRDRCYSCEVRFLETSIVRPLVERLGRKGARKALRRLARGK